MFFISISFVFDTVSDDSRVHHLFHIGQ